MALVWKKGKISLRFVTVVPYILPLTLWLKTGFPEVTELPDISVLNSLKMDLQPKCFLWLILIAGCELQGEATLGTNAFSSSAGIHLIRNHHFRVILCTLCTHYVHSNFSNELCWYSKVFFHSSYWFFSYVFIIIIILWYVIFEEKYT